MRRMVVGVFGAMLVIALASPLWAQPSPVRAFVDIPAEHSVWPHGLFYVAGWNLNCYTGQQVPEIKVYYVPDGSGPLVHVRDAQVVWRLVRPDVQAAAPNLCHAADVPWVVPATAHLGFAVFFPTPIPRGPDRRIVVQFTDSAVWPTTDSALGTVYIQRLVTIQ